MYYILLIFKLYTLIIYNILLANAIFDVWYIGYYRVYYNIKFVYFTYRNNMLDFQGAHPVYYILGDNICSIHKFCTPTSVYDRAAIVNYGFYTLSKV